MDSGLITSGQNEQIKFVKRLQQKKYRDRENMFCLEGVRLVEEALPTGLVQSVFFSEQLFSSPRGTALLGKVQKLGLAHRQCGVEIFNESQIPSAPRGLSRWRPNHHGPPFHLVVPC